ncbi:hypothetical protein, partial [Acetobacter pomorum]|uniref:hypothetical protein n=1 Tax=Acetobacter pomorum TaxID=65959 RepID=UPI00222F16BE
EVLNNQKMIQNYSICEISASNLGHGQPNTHATNSGFSQQTQTNTFTHFRIRSIWCGKNMHISACSGRSYGIMAFQPYSRLYIFGVQTLTTRKNLPYA